MNLTVWGRKKKMSNLPQAAVEDPVSTTDVEIVIGDTAYTATVSELPRDPRVLSCDLRHHDSQRKFGAPLFPVTDFWGAETVVRCFRKEGDASFRLIQAEPRIQLELVFNFLGSEKKKELTFAPLAEDQVIVLERRVKRLEDRVAELESKKIVALFAYGQHGLKICFKHEGRKFKVYIPEMQQTTLVFIFSDGTRLSTGWRESWNMPVGYDNAWTCDDFHVLWFDWQTKEFALLREGETPPSPTTSCALVKMVCGGIIPMVHGDIFQVIGGYLSS